MQTKRIVLSFGVLLTLVACKPKSTELPPLLAPVIPRQGLDAQTLKLRLMVGEALDRTGAAGGVVDTGTTGGALVRSGNLLIAPPTREMTAVSNNGSVGVASRDPGFPGGPLSVVSVPDGQRALTQTMGATLQSMAALSDRFEVLSGAPGESCDFVLKTWVTGTSSEELHVDQVLESCDFGIAVSAINGTVRFARSNQDVLLDRSDVKRLLKNLIATLPEPAEMGKGTILERQGRYVTINLGSEQRVKKGMKAFAVSYGDRKVDEKTGISLGDELLTGDLYIFAVYPKLSRAWIVKEPSDDLGDHSRVRVGDYVVFK